MISNIRCTVDSIVRAVDVGNCACAAFLDVRKSFYSQITAFCQGISKNWQSQLLSLSGLLIISVIVCITMQHVKWNDQYYDWGLVLEAFLRGMLLVPQCLSTMQGIIDRHKALWIKINLLHSEHTKIVTLRPLVVPLLYLGCYSLGPSGC